MSRRGPRRGASWHQTASPARLASPDPIRAWVYLPGPVSDAPDAEGHKAFILDILAILAAPRGLPEVLPRPSSTQTHFLGNLSGGA